MDAHTVKVELATGGTKTITGKHILLAVGGKPVKAPIPGSVRALPCLPGTLAVDVMTHKKLYWSYTEAEP